MASNNKKDRLIYVSNTIFSSWRAGSLHTKALARQFHEKVEHFLLISQEDKASGIVMEKPSCQHHFLSVLRLPFSQLFLLLRLWLVLSKQTKSNLFTRYTLLPLVNFKHRCVVEFHSDKWNNSFLEKLAFRRVMKGKNNIGVVCITHALAQELKKNFPAFNKPLSVIEDAAEVPHHTYTARFEEKTQLNVGYVGSFHRGKGLEMVLELAKLLPEHNFVIIGGKPEQIKKLKHTHPFKNIDFKGYVQQGNLWKEMLEIDICLLPNQPVVKTGKSSDIGKYTSPLKMFEYMAFKKPMIASDLSVLKEVLNEDVAILVPHNDTVAWARAVEGLVDVEKRKKQAQNAFAMFNEKYTWNKRADRILRLFSKNETLS